MTDPWTVATALGTIGSAAFVGWQAWLTRGVLKATQAATEPPRISAIYAARAGMDADAPKIQIYAETQGLVWEPSTSAHLGGQAQQISPGTEWYFPRDAEKRILIKLIVRIANKGEHLADLSFGGLIYEPNGTHARDITLLPSGDSNGAPWLMEANFSVRQWSENWSASQRGNSLPHVARADVTCTDARDEGVDDAWSMQIEACPIRPAPDREGVWQLNLDAEGAISSGALRYPIRPPRKRVYWISRSEGKLLGDPFAVRK